MTIGAAQLGPIQRADGRADVVKRLLALLHEAKARGAELVVFPELALTTFFPRWWMEDQAEIDAFFETEMPGPETKPLFDEARRLGLGFCLGYAEKTADGHRYNTSILVDAGGRVVLTYRKIHLPGHAGHEPWRPFQHLASHPDADAHLHRDHPAKPQLAETDADRRLQRVAPPVSAGEPAPRDRRKRPGRRGR